LHLLFHSKVFFLQRKRGALIASFELQCLSSFSHKSRRECMHTPRPGGDIRENYRGTKGPGISSLHLWVGKKEPKAQSGFWLA
jgi:hypothetical protein